MKVKSLIGQRFGRLIVYAIAPKFLWKTTNAEWYCYCQCGKSQVLVRSNSLMTNRTKSCGCLSVENGRLRGNNNVKHGHNRRSKVSPIYHSWHSMIQRCTNPKTKHYKSYGGRSITVCERWLNSFENFLDDMGERPEGKTLDRIEVNGNYEPNNCKWSTPKEQMSNLRTSLKNF